MTLVDVDFPELAGAGAVNRVIVAEEAHAIHEGHLSALETHRRSARPQAYPVGRELCRGRGRGGPQDQTGRHRGVFTAGHGLRRDRAPTVPIVPPTIAEVEEDFDRLNALILRNPSTINFLDGCAATVPMHEAGELPSGLMIVGPAGADWKILAIADVLEGIVGAR